MEVKHNSRRTINKTKQLGPYPMERLKHVEKPTNLITENVQRIDARKRVISRLEEGEFGAVLKNKSSEIMRDHEPVRDSVRDIMKQIGSTKSNPVAGIKAQIPEDPALLSRHIKRFGYFLGADVMGICRVPPTTVYSHDRKGNPIELNYKNAIVIVVRKDLKTVTASEGADWIADALSFRAYQISSAMAETLANYIRRLGFPAMAQSAGSGYSLMIPPLLLQAGIGEVCRTGIILNPFLGLGYKASAVLTDLPLEPDKPVDFGLQEFCKRCKKCSEMCPSHAISTGDKVMYNGYETWKVNERRCAAFCVSNRKGFWCNTCVKVCPWTRPNTWPHNLVRWGVQRSGLAASLAVKGDRWFGHSKGVEGDKWWFDLVDSGGALVDPNSADWGRENVQALSDSDYEEL